MADREPRAPLHDRDPIAFAKRQLRRRFQADRVRAARLIMQEINQSIARCEALEAAALHAPDASPVETS